jgi:hypothetical protein
MNIKRKKLTVRDNWGLFTHSPCCRSFICLKVLPEGLIMEAKSKTKKNKEKQHKE